MYTVSQLVDILNEKYPLNKDNINIADKRRASTWTLRMVRDYISKHKITGVREGKYVMYDDSHVKQIANIYMLGVSMSSYTRVVNEQTKKISSDEEVMSFLQSFSGNERVTSVDDTSNMLEFGKNVTPYLNSSAMSNVVDDNIKRLSFMDVDVCYSSSNKDDVIDALKKIIKHIEEKK